MAPQVSMISRLLSSSQNRSAYRATIGGMLEQVPDTFFGSILLVVCAWVLLSIASIAIAQTGPITPSGLGTEVSGPLVVGGQTQYDITGGTRPGGGANLFHSFGDFGVPTNNIANFLNETALPTSNILGRVTGGNISNIFGTIQTTGFGNANLFLMNPAGFLFGPNATVNVGGMVSFTSADYLKLTDNARFNAIPDVPADALLSPAPVAAFGFLGSNPGAITVQGSQFTVTEGTGISLVSGNITIQSGVLNDGVTIQPSRFLAPGGQINLASVASPGEILLSNLQSAPNINGQSFTAMGNISLSQGALLDVSADAAGTVRIRSGQLVMDQATISADTVNANGAPVAIDVNVTGDVSVSAVDVPALTARTTGSGNAGEVRISSQNLEVTATALNTFISSVIDTHTSGSGKAGDVNITTTENLKATTDNSGFISFIDSGTVGPDGGHGGNVTLNAQNAEIERAQIITGDLLALFNGEIAAGSGGNLTINADTLTVVNSGFATTAFSAGRGGDLTISARDAQIVEGSFLDANGAITGGTIQINADHLSVDSSQMDSGGGIIFNGRIGEFTNGSTVSTSTGLDVNAGNITFTATERLTFADFTTPDATPIRPSGLFTTTVFDTGSSGIVTVNTPLLQLSGGARFDATTTTSGHGGSINVVADTLSISGERPLPIFEGPLFGLVTSLASGIYSRTVQSQFCGGPCGNAGPISVTSNSINLSQGGRIDSSTSSAGRGGNITINGNQISIAGTTTKGEPSGVFTTASAAGTGGNIFMTAGQLVTISDGATVSASSTGSGNAGNITLQGLASPAESVLIDGPESGIFTDTQGSGVGGNIFVNANSVTLQNGGTLSAETSGTAPTATGGTITLDANQVQLLTGGLITAATAGPGNAGSVMINAADSVIIAGQVSTSIPPLSARSRITTTTSSSGDGGDVTITAGQSVSLTGNRSGIFADTTSSGNAGNISITAGTFNLDGRARLTTETGAGTTGNAGSAIMEANQVSLAGNSRIDSLTRGSGQGGTIKIAADESISLVDATINTSSVPDPADLPDAGSGGLIWLSAPTIDLRHGNLNTLALGAGNAGSVLLEGRTIALGQNEFGSESIIQATTSGAGRGGDITIRGMAGPGSRADDVTISGFSLVLSETSGSGGGQAGNIAINAARLTIDEGGRVGTDAVSSAIGNAGTVLLNASETVRITNNAVVGSNSIEQSEGNAGKVIVVAPTVIVENGGVISTSTELKGNAGSIEINTGNLFVSSGGQISSSSVDVLPGVPEFVPTGAAGNVTVQGQIAGSRTNSVLIDGVGSGIFTDTQGTGVGGNITLNANTVTLQNGGTLSAETSGTAATAIGGTITVDATNTVTMNSALITAKSAGVADAGNINIASPNGFTMQNSSITTEVTPPATPGASNAGGGNITITTTDVATVELVNSKIIASVADGPGGGGNISIDPQFVILQNSQILAQAAQGQGGAITITAGLFLPDANSIVNADSRFGVNGTVTIQSPNAPGSGQVQPLGKTPLQATSLLNQHCASLAGGEFSSFTVAGRDSLPTEPSSWLASPLALSQNGFTVGPVPARGAQTRVVDPTDETTVLSLRQIAPPGFLTQSFAADWSAGCKS